VLSSLITKKRIRKVGSWDWQNIKKAPLNIMKTENAVLSLRQNEEKR
jgi:hypothetical protein